MIDLNELHFEVKQAFCIGPMSALESRLDNVFARAKERQKQMNQKSKYTLRQILVVAFVAIALFLLGAEFACFVSKLAVP